MKPVLAWAAIASTVFLAATAYRSAQAQTREEMIQRFKGPCIAQNMHLRSQGYEAVKARVVECVKAKAVAYKRGMIKGHLKASRDRIGDLVSAGDLNGAEAEARRTIAWAGQIANSELPAASGYLTLGVVQMYRGRFQDAEGSARKATLIFERGFGTESVNTARAYGVLAYALTSQGKRAEAESYFTRALAIQERDPGPEHPETALTLTHFAMLRLEQGRPAEAEPMALRAVAINQRNQGVRAGTTVNAMQTLGAIQYYWGRFADAEATLKSALTIAEQSIGAKSFQTAGLLATLADLYVNSGRHEEAEPLLQRALPILMETLGPEHRLTFRAMRALAAVKMRSGEAREGETILRRAIAAAQKAVGSDHTELYVMHRLLNESMVRQNRLADAEKATDEALRIAEAINKDSFLVSDLLRVRGRLFTATGRMDEARTALEKSIAMNTEKHGPLHLSTVRSMVGLAELDLLTRNPNEALELLKRAVTGIETRRGTGTLLGDERYENDIVSLLKDTAVAIARAEWEAEGTSGAGPSAFRGAQLLKQSVAGAALSQMAGRFAAANDALGRLVRQGQDLVSRWHAIDRQLTLSSGDAAEPKVRQELRAELAKIDQELADIGSRVAKEFPDYVALTRATPLQIEDVQKVLRPEEVFLTFLLEGDSSFVWAITRDQSAWAKLAVSPQEIGEQVAALRCGLDESLWDGAAGKRCEQLLGAKPTTEMVGLVPTRILPFSLARAHQLYKSLFGPVEHLIGSWHLIIAPNGPLATLPVHVLVTTPVVGSSLHDAPNFADVPWLAKQNAITVLPSVSSFKALRQYAKASGASKPYIGFGNPLLLGPNGQDRSASERQRCPDLPAKPVRAATRNISLPASRFVRSGRADVALIRQQWPLPETADELCAVARATGSGGDAVHLGADATETTLKAFSVDGSLAKFRIVHFATHGLLASEASLLHGGGGAEPALILTPPETPTETDDGLLMASEIARLRLDADWVVLSACNSAAGSAYGEAMSGLARAFFYAGARALLVSHWAVDSQSAVDLVSTTFAFLQADPGLGRSEALRRAMGLLIGAGGAKSHPANWAPFVVVGEGATTETVTSAFERVAALPQAATSAPMVDTPTLTRNVQRELERVGCDPGPVDGTWGYRPAAALERFSRYAKVSLPLDQPTAQALDALSAQKVRVCPPACQDSQHLEGNNCVTAPKRSPPDTAVPGVRRPATKSAERKPGGYTTCGRNGCQYVPPGCYAVRHSGGGGLGGRIFCQ